MKIQHYACNHRNDDVTLLPLIVVERMLPKKSWSLQQSRLHASYVHNLQSENPRQTPVFVILTSFKPLSFWSPKLDSPTEFYILVELGAIPTPLHDSMEDPLEDHDSRGLGGLTPVTPCMAPPMVLRMRRPTRFTNNDKKKKDQPQQYRVIQDD